MDENSMPKVNEIKGCLIKLSREDQLPHPTPQLKMSDGTDVKNCFVHSLLFVCCKIRPLFNAIRTANDKAAKFLLDAANDLTCLGLLYQCLHAMDTCPVESQDHLKYHYEQFFKFLCEKIQLESSKIVRGQHGNAEDLIRHFFKFLQKLPLSASFNQLSGGHDKEQFLKALVDVIRTYRQQLMTELENDTVCKVCAKSHKGSRIVDEAVIVVG